MEKHLTYIFKGILSGTLAHHIPTSVLPIVVEMEKNRLKFDLAGRLMKFYWHFLFIFAITGEKQNFKKAFSHQNCTVRLNW
jgi:hypothetical protein